MVDHSSAEPFAAAGTSDEAAECQKIHRLDAAVDRERLKAIVARRLGPRFRAKLDASDIIQSGLVAAFKNWETCKATTDSERWAWIVAIVVNKLRSALRFWGRGRRDGDREAAEGVYEIPDAQSGRSPSRQLIRAEQCSQILEQLQQLPDAERNAVAWHYLEGLSVDEVANRLGRTRQAAAGVLKRGIKRLKKAFGEHGE